MLWKLHGLTVEGIWDDAPIGERWQATFASRPSGQWPPDLVFRLALVKETPPAPSGPPDFRQGDLLAYYLRGTQPAGQGASGVTAHFPRYGQLQLHLGRGTTTGVITSAALAAYGVFEDLLAVGLSPHLRRRGMFLIHAFAAAPASPARALPRREPEGNSLSELSTMPLRGFAPETALEKGVLLVGDIGAGKTTTGLALLHAGWKLLSNDSPILHNGGQVEILSYPGLLSVYPDSLLRFPELHRFVTTDDLPSSASERRKVTFAAEEVYPDVWRERAIPGAILFPQIEARADHALERLPTPEALQLILPHAAEQWDREMIPEHLALLNQLVQVAPAYRLRLGPDVNAIPAAVAPVLA